MGSIDKKNIIMSLVMSLAIHSLAIAGLVGGFSLFNSLGTSENGGRGLGVGDSKEIPQYIQVSSVSVETSAMEKTDVLTNSAVVEKIVNEKKKTSKVVEYEIQASVSQPQRELGNSGNTDRGGSGSEGLATELSLYVKEVKKLIAKKSFYPRSAKKRGIEGTVNVSFSVDSDGAVYDVVISKASGFNLLDENALSIVKSVSPLPVPPRDDLRLELPLVFSIKTIW